MELSEPERATARFQAVVSSLLSAGRGAQLLAYSPREARLLLGADKPRELPVLAQVLLSQAEDSAALRLRCQPLLTELLASRSGDPAGRFQLRLLIVAPDADAEPVDAVLRELRASAPAAPTLQAFLITSDGALHPPAGAQFSEVGPALSDQAKGPLVLTPEAEFAARCLEAIRKTQESHRAVRDFAQLLQQRRTPATYALLALNLVLFALSYLFGNPDQLATLGRMGAASSQHILAGQWWRLLAATALHGGPLHILFNSLGLWNLGRLLEGLLGSWRFLSLYVLSGLSGSLLGVALANSSSVGASGAICGLLAAAAALGVRPRGELPPPIAHNLKNMALANLGITALVSLQARVDWRAHLGGALIGALVVLVGLLRPTVGKPAAAPIGQWGHALLGTIAAVALLLSIGVALLRGQPWLLTHPEQRQRIALPGTPFSLEVPRSFGAGAAGTSGEGTMSRVFDDPIESPGLLVLTAEPTKLPLPKAADRQLFSIPLFQSAEENAAARLKSVSGHRSTIDDFPVMALSGVLPKGERVQQVIQVRASYLLIVQLRMRPDTPQRMVPDLEELIATIQPREP